MKVAAKHLLTIRDLTTQEVIGLVNRGAQLKAGWETGYRPKPLMDKTVALVFEKPSTRTRVSFEVATFHLGGQTVFMTSKDSQLSRSEPLKDTARVMSRYVEALVVRTFGHDVVEELASYAGIPVINALTDLYHPCQVLSDLLTVRERFGRLQDLSYCWLGDGNNMAHSWLEAAAKLGFRLCLACPEGYDPNPDIVEHARAAGAEVILTRNIREAIEGAHVVNTDVWASMGQEGQVANRNQAFQGFTLDKELLSLASPDAIVLHCLPAHRGEEITDEVMEGPRSVVWDQAENRLHVQKAILETLVAGVRAVNAPTLPWPELEK